MNRAVPDTYASTPPRSTIEAGPTAWCAGDVEGSSIDHVWLNTRVFLSGDRTARPSGSRSARQHAVLVVDRIRSIGSRTT